MKSGVQITNGLPQDSQPSGSQLDEERKLLSRRIEILEQRLLIIRHTRRDPPAVKGSVSGPTRDGAKKHVARAFNPDRKEKRWGKPELKPAE